jgi:hypothetical protein
MDVESAYDRRLRRTAEVVWSWRLEVGVKPAELSAGDGVKQNLITGESTEEALKPSCAGMPG